MSDRSRKQKVLGKNQRTTNSGKEQRTQRSHKNGGKTRLCTFGAKLETKASRRQLKLLLPGIFINSLPRFIEKVLKNN